MPKIVDPEERRARIAETVAHMIASVGLEKTTMREIARVSGFSKGIIEHYFESKEEIIEVALSWANQHYLDRITDATRDERGLDAIRLRLENILPLTDAIREEWIIRLQFWTLATLDPHLQKEQAARFLLAKEHFHADLKEARKLGQVRADLSLADAAHQLTYTATAMSIASLHNPEYFSVRRMRQTIAKMLKDMAA